ncbi:hypothetical protein GLOIN_2v1472048 [Rhizophagus irregularis DAOM 181602=DAOM 197198]|uniref:Uncharacterized protein n=1 Tax=Rhizophagus irregularis (strain DAOM 181602 / DAOM 197198 / MUCL 43194) TaxID=747089 RepID=A0A2P4QQ87_RHIID|nr:hypothetical protein GLOIN_2v1472048 [Rhizophagus irregularis DAOM 181602=DAOM 197198]POG79814.1 hypothetical protein GLOIN_2v1472048 [Rhizophagus irregularis DAOM 181602=DAOM 197198]|eukprot:XP_025186680.1 hypothetical protein GLOIN_2v1472048 [Rhizophagus irregularis DAOM 181602=DAOM 197198]
MAIIVTFGKSDYCNEITKVNSSLVPCLLLPRNGQLASSKMAISAEYRNAFLIYFFFFSLFQDDKFDMCLPLNIGMLYLLTLLWNCNCACCVCYIRKTKIQKKKKINQRKEVSRSIYKYKGCHLNLKICKLVTLLGRRQSWSNRRYLKEGIEMSIK